MKEKWFHSHQDEAASKADIVLLLTLLLDTRKDIFGALKNVLKDRVRRDAESSQFRSRAPKSKRAETQHRSSEANNLHVRGVS